MTKHELINGWTKDSLKAAIKKYNNGNKAVNFNSPGCRYLTDDGNRCAIGCCLPYILNGSDAHLHMNRTITELVELYPELKEHLPFNIFGSQKFQEAHDTYKDEWPNEYTLHDVLFKFIDERTYETGETV